MFPESSAVADPIPADVESRPLGRVTFKVQTSRVDVLALRVMSPPLVTDFGAVRVMFALTDVAGEFEGDEEAEGEPIGEGVEAGVGGVESVGAAVGTGVEAPFTYCAYAVIQFEAIAC